MGTALRSLLCAALCLLSWDTGSSWAGRPAPYRDLSKAGVGFFGPGREDPPPAGLKSVRLGLIGPEKSPAGDQLRLGVALAVSEANARGGFGGLPYEIVFRADDGPWGMGAKQVAALAYEDSVWVILGALEGGDAHLAELIAAKVWVPVVTPTAADMTIDYANVPWVFRCFPSDDRQARALLGYARERGFQRIAVFSEGDREGRTGFRRLEDAARMEQVNLVQHQEYESHFPPAVLGFEGLHSADAVVIWGRAESALRLIRAMRQEGFDGPVLGPAGLLSEELLTATDDLNLGEIIIAAPYELNRDDARMREFYERYQERTGLYPDPVALYAYDTTCLVISAIERAGLNRARIRDALAKRAYEGIVGAFQFDGLGGSSLEPVLMASRNGTWTRVGTGPEGWRSDPGEH